MSVTLILRDQQHEVKAGMTLRHSLMKIGVLPETVLATREGQMITEDEVLNDGDVIKLIAVISGGSSVNLRPDSPRRRPTNQEDPLVELKH